MSRRAKPEKRTYVSVRRVAAAQRTRERVLTAAQALYSARPVEEVILGEIAAAARVSPSTIYATFRSRDGILRSLMERALFGPHYAAAIARLADETDPVRLIELSAGGAW